MSVIHARPPAGTLCRVLRKRKPLGAGHGIRFTKGKRMKIEFVNATVEVVMIIVVIVAFLFLFKMRKKLEPKDKIYVQIRNMLREILVPLGFMEEESSDFDNSATYKRETFLVEIFFDRRERQYLLFVSSDVRSPLTPPRQVSITFSPTEYNDEKKKQINDTLQQWLSKFNLN